MSLHHRLRTETRAAHDRSETACGLAARIPADARVPADARIPAEA